MSTSERPTAVSVSIVNHSTRDALHRALEALAADATRQTPIEIVVLDNSSDDDSVAFLRRHHPEAHVIAKSERRGFGANHNELIRRTRAEFVLLLNPDTELAPGALDRMALFLADRPGAAAVGPRTLQADGRARESAWHFPSPAWTAIFAASFTRLRGCQSRGDRARTVSQLAAAALLLRRSAVEQIGLFDEAFFMYCEDADLCRRLADAGYERCYLPSAVAVHHGFGSTEEHVYERITEYWRSRRLYWRKHHGRLSCRVCSVMAGLPYAMAAGVARPLRAAKAPIFTHHVRNAWFGPAGPGLRELALKADQTPR